jgi:hypothetical protein
MWVKVGGVEEQIADIHPNKFEKTDMITKNGYNSYIMHNIDIS